MSHARPDEQLFSESSELILISAGRTTGDPQEATLRFVYEDGSVFLLANVGQDDVWYHNLEKDRGVVLKVKKRGFRGRASLYDARQRPKVVSQIAARLKEKYGAAAPGDRDLSKYLPVMIEVQF